MSRAGPWRDPRALLSSLVVHLGVLGLLVLASWGMRESVATRWRSGAIDAELGSDAEEDAREREEAEREVSEGVAVELDGATRGAAQLSLPGEGRPGAVFAGGEAALEGAEKSGGEGGRGGIGEGAADGLAPVEFFGARERGESFAYVIDRSGSMGSRGALAAAKRELQASLGRVPAAARFGVVFYNLEAEVFADAGGREGLMANDAANRAAVDERLDATDARGGTRPRPALRAALAMRPEVVFLLTDGQELSEDDLRALGPELEASGTRVHVIEIGGGPPLGGQEPLERLAAMTGGTYQRIDPGRMGRH
jgi:hypothetical protein